MRPIGQVLHSRGDLFPRNLGTELPDEHPAKANASTEVLQKSAGRNTLCQGFSQPLFRRIDKGLRGFKALFSSPPVRATSRHRAEDPERRGFTPCNRTDGERRETRRPPPRGAQGLARTRGRYLSVEGTSALLAPGSG